jgi:hypothetical protein
MGLLTISRKESKGRILSLRHTVCSAEKSARKLCANRAKPAQYEFQPQNRQLFALQTGLETALLCHSAATSRRRLSPDKRLIPCNLRKRQLLRHPNLYRRFESFPLRHTMRIVIHLVVLTSLELLRHTASWPDLARKSQIPTGNNSRGRMKVIEIHLQRIRATIAVTSSDCFPALN